MSASAQVEATIIAIFISILLVAIQLTLKDYSEIVLDVYRKNKSFWSILILYLVSIVILLISLANVEALTNWIKIYIFLVVINLLILLPYIILYTFELLSPQKIAEKFTNMYKISYNNGDNFNILRKYIEISEKSIDSHNVKFGVSILDKIRKSVSEELKVINYELIKDISKLEDILLFFENISFWLRALTLYIIDRYEHRIITKNESDWLMNIIIKILRDLWANLVIGLYPFYSNQETEEKLERCLNRCLIELETIVGKLKTVPDLEDNLSNFLNVIPFRQIEDLASKNKKLEHIAERVKKLKSP